MNFDDLSKKGLIKAIKPVRKQINDLFTSAEKDIQVAGDLLRLGHYGIARDTAYESMLKSGMALCISMVIDR